MPLSFMQTFYISAMMYGNECVTFTVAPGCKLRQDARGVEEVAASAQAKGHIVASLGPEDDKPAESDRIVKALEAAGLFRWGLASVLSTRYFLTHRIEVPSAKV